MNTCNHTLNSVHSKSGGVIHHKHIRTAGLTYAVDQGGADFFNQKTMKEGEVHIMLIF